MINSLKSNVTSFFNSILLIVKHKALLIEMTSRELTDQYAGQVFGFLWSIIHPIVFIGVYIFIFGVVFKTKIGGTYDMPLDYTTYILSGLVPWLSFQTAISKASIALTNSSNLVKQVVFPIEILPVKMVLSTIYTQLISIIVLFIYVLCKYGALLPSYALLPILLGFQFLGTMGVAFILSITSPFVRDLKDFINVYSIVGIYFIPVVYLPKWIPVLFKPIIYLNPLSYMIWCYQDVLYYGRIMHPSAWFVFCIGSLVLYIVGFKFFQRLKLLVGNVL